MSWYYRGFLFTLGAMMGGTIFIVTSILGSPHP